MKVYIAYKFSGNDLEKLKSNLIEFDKVIKKLKHHSFIFFRDVQNWVKGNSSAKSIITEAFENIKKCDVILAIIESPEKSEGMLLECGYGKALGKKIIVASKPEGRAFLLKAMADTFFEFNNLNDFELKLKEVL